MKSYVQVYTGDGKGKTTAAIGLAIRAAGAGMQVLFAQFVKGREYSEIAALRRFEDTITIKQFGRGCFIVREPEEGDIRAGQAGLEEVAKDLTSGDYQLVVLDEVTIALYYKLFGVDELLKAVKNRHPGCEVVLTGRKAPAELIETADLVTEMKDLKHYYYQGVTARKGIES